MPVWEDMTHAGIVPIPQHFTSFLKACCGASLSAREIQLVFARSLAFCGNTGGDCYVYAALLKFCVAQFIPEKAVDVWRAIFKVLCHPMLADFPLSALWLDSLTWVAGFSILAGCFFQNEWLVLPLVSHSMPHQLMHHALHLSFSKFSWHRREVFVNTTPCMAGILQPR
jgi:hypothetical protein